MAAATLGDYLLRLKQLMVAGTLSTAADHELLQNFLTERSEAAFTALMSRHGPLVLRVCRRALSSPQDVEDAFQATFLVLARQAHAIRKRTSLACWLHGVAHRIALETRSKSARRRKHEQRAGTEAAPVQLSDDTTWKELQSVLDEELTRLPDRLRAPLILCYLQGLTQDEAAGQLRQSKSTFRRRLEEGRGLLASRLAGRGVALSAALFAPLLSESVSWAALPPGLLDSTIKAAAVVAAGQAVPAAVSAKVVALTEGALNAMLTTRFKTVGMLLLAASVLGAALAAYQVMARDDKPKPDTTPKPAQADPAPKDKPDPLIAKAVASALAEAESVPDLFDRAVAFGRIALAQDRAGQKEAAAATLRKALEAEAREQGRAVRLHKDNRMWIIAEYQAQTGDAKGALETVQGSVSQMNQAHALGLIAEAMAQAGDVKGALATAEKIESAEVIDGVLVTVVRSQVRSGDLTGALKTAERIGAGSSVNNAIALAEIGAGHAAAGKSEDAVKLFTRAHELAGKADRKVLAHVHMAKSQAAAGFVEEACKTAADIEDKESRDYTYQLMTAALAGRGDVKAAREVADKIGEGVARGMALKEVVAALIRAKDLAEAVKVADAIKDDMGRCYSLMELAKAQAAAGQKDAAEKSLKSALKLADALEDPKGTRGVRAGSLALYAGARAAAGDAEGALEWAGKQDDVGVRVMARVRIAEALADRSR